MIAIGVKTIKGLHFSLIRAGSESCLIDIVANHLFTDDGFVYEQHKVHRGSVEYAFLEMKRELLLKQATDDVRNFRGVDRSKIDVNRCSYCHVQYYFDARTSENVCPQCGITVFVLETEHREFNSRSRYNRPGKHKYRKREHFFQTLLDVTCTGRRNIAFPIVNYCRCVLGRGSHITFLDVYRALQEGGYRAFYPLKYEIAAHLRGRPEITLSCREMERVRGEYIRYDRCFHDFQKHHKIGNRTMSGGLRLFWPVRYVMARIFELIDRGDLLVSLRKISGQARKVMYDKYWRKLERWVNKREPLKGNNHHKLIMTPLPLRPKRVKYSRLLAANLDSLRQQTTVSSASSSASSSLLASQLPKKT